jgi:hypothetical protein
MICTRALKRRSRPTCAWGFRTALGDGVRLFIPADALGDVGRMPTNESGTESGMSASGREYEPPPFMGDTSPSHVSPMAPLERLML